MRAVKIAFFALIAVAIVSFAVMVLWNTLLPNIFAVKAITFWQALGLLVLSKLFLVAFDRTVTAVDTGDVVWSSVGSR